MQVSRAHTTSVSVQPLGFSPQMLTVCRSSSARRVRNPGRLQHLSSSLRAPAPTFGEPGRQTPKLAEIVSNKSPYEPRRVMHAL